MKSLEDTPLGHKLMMMLISPNGFGKTLAISSFYKRAIKRNGKMYWFDFDGRMKPILTHNKEAIPHIKYDTYGSHNLNQLDWDFNKGIESSECAAVVLDSFTSLSMASVNYSMRLKGLMDKDGSLIIPGWDEINEETALIGRIIEKCKIIDKDVFMTAHPIPRVKTTGSGKMMKVERISTIAAYGPKINIIAPGYFDEIYTLVTKQGINPGEIKRIAYTYPQDDELGKTALGLPGELDITKESLYDVMKRILGEKGIEL